MQIIAATLMSYYLKINEEFNVEIVGHIPRGYVCLTCSPVLFLQVLIHNQTQSYDQV